MSAKKLKILLVSSSGGHWIQMNRVVPAFESEDLHFACTDETYHQTNPQHPFYYIPEASRSAGPVKLLWQAWCVLKLLVRLQPDLIVSTGASVGFFAVFFGKKLGKKTIWLDSIANVEQISLSGEKAQKHSDLFITQWQHLADQKQIRYFGSVI